MRFLVSISSTTLLLMLTACASTAEDESSQDSELRAAATCPADVRPQPRQGAPWTDGHVYWCESPEFVGAGPYGQFAVHMVTTPSGDIAVHNANSRNWGVGKISDEKSALCSAEAAPKISLGYPRAGEWTISEATPPNGPPDAVGFRKANLTLTREGKDPLSLEVSCRGASCGLLPAMARSLCYSQEGITY
jgi:hypothetical protein